MLLVQYSIIRTQCVSNNTHAPLLSTVVAHSYSTPHTLWGCTVELASALTAAAIMADAAVTLLSPK